MLKKLIALIFVFTSLFLLISCPPYNKHLSVIVTIKSEYKDEFEEEKITIEDLLYDNIESIEYGEWDYEHDYGLITVYLKKTGKKQVEQAIKHFLTLEFVLTAEAGD